MKKKEKEKEKGKVRNSLVFYTHRLLQIYGHTIVGGCSTIETQSDTLDDLHSRSSEDNHNLNQSFQFFAFQCFTPSSMSTQRNTTSVVYRAYSHSLARTQIDKSSILFRTRI